jgi:hypothetical protein
VSDLSWEDLRLLSTLAFEKADDQTLPMAERDRWSDIAERVFASTARPKDLLAVAELAELDAAQQRDAKVRQRYLDLAARAIAVA